MYLRTSPFLGQYLGEATFFKTAIDQMRNFVDQNATEPQEPGSRGGCLKCLRGSLETLFALPGLKGNRKLDSIDKVMQWLAKAGKAGAPYTLRFETSTGQVNSGSKRPYRLHESLSGTLLKMAAGDRGWIVFGLSVSDGNHSVLLTLDSTDRANPRFFWSDQKGWKVFDRASLDAELTRWTQFLWDYVPRKAVERGKKPYRPKTHATLWRLRP
jgi:hypothetical protein